MLAKHNKVTNILYPCKKGNWQNYTIHYVLFFWHNNVKEKNIIIIRFLQCVKDTEI